MEGEFLLVPFPYQDGDERSRVGDLGADGMCLGGMDRFVVKRDLY